MTADVNTSQDARRFAIQASMEIMSDCRDPAVVITYAKEIEKYLLGGASDRCEPAPGMTKEEFKLELAKAGFGFVYIDEAPNYSECVNITVASGRHKNNVVLLGATVDKVPPQQWANTATLLIGWLNMIKEGEATK